MMNVSRETMDKVNKYIDELFKWNSKINLVSRSLSRDDILLNHFYDSLLLKDMIRENEVVIDLGSGGGLPAVMVSMLVPNEILLIERNHKKSAFLKHIKSMLNLKINILTKDVKDIDFDNEYVCFTSKAMATCKEIFALIGHLIKPNTRLLLLKNNTQLFEVDELQIDWSFKFELHKNSYNNSMVFEFYNISKKNGS